MVRFKTAMLLGASLAFLAACERPSAVAKYEDEAPSRERQATASVGGTPRTARREEPVQLVDGKPMWSASRRGTAEENARRSFERNGEAFGARDLDAFVQKAHDFIDRPPAGVQRLTRNNGDVLLYDPKDNVFVVATREGAPRTMFKPEEGAAYWDEQVQREQRRQTASRRDGGDSEES